MFFDTGLEFLLHFAFRIAPFFLVLAADAPTLRATPLVAIETLAILFLAF